MAKALRHKNTSGRRWDLKCPRVQLLESALLINGKRHNLPITKEYILKEYHNKFNEIATLPGDEYYITLEKGYIPVQHPTRLVPFKLKSVYKEELQQLCNQGIITLVQEHSECTNSIVLIRKVDSSLRVCLDPKDLNKNIERN